MTAFGTWVDIRDLNTHATFCDDRLRGLGVAKGRISRFTIDLRRRPYKHFPTTRAGFRHVQGVQLNRGLHHLGPPPTKEKNLNLFFLVID